MDRVVVIGGHSLYRKVISQALINACNEVVVCDEEIETVMITKMPDFQEPFLCGDMRKKSKGDKRRERSERRRKWGI